MFNPAELGEIAAWQAAAKNAEAAKTYAEAFEKTVDTYLSWKKYARKLEQQVVDLKDQLAVETADNAGLTAIVEAFKQAHPDSPLMRPNGKRFRESGNPKRYYHELYEAAFDRKAREMGIDDPAERRAD